MNQPSKYTSGRINHPICEACVIGTDMCRKKRENVPSLRSLAQRRGRKRYMRTSRASSIRKQIRQIWRRGWDSTHSGILRIGNRFYEKLETPEAAKTPV